MKSKLEFDSGHRPACLNLACGNKYMETSNMEIWYNLDISNKDTYGNEIKVDYKHDLNKFPYPFNDNTFSYVRAWAIIEHLDNPEKVVKELTRICKSGAIIEILVPHFSHKYCHRDPTHIHFYTFDSIDFPQLNCGNKVISKEYQISHNFFINMIGKIITFSPTLYETFLHGYFPVQEVRWKLKVIK